MSNCVKAIPRAAVNIYKLFKEIISTNSKSFDGIKNLYSKENIDWACKIWIKNYDNLRKTPDIFYMTLVLLNRKSLCGKFSLVYNDNVYKSIKDKKEKDLLKLYSNPYFSELYDNKDLSKEEKEELEILLKKEMLALNFYVKKLEAMEKVPENFLESEEYKECFYQIHQALNIQISLQDSKKLNTCVVDYIIIEEYNDNVEAQYIMYFDILHLLSLIYFDENNTYTNKPFNVNTINNIKKKYEFEMKLLKRSYGNNGFKKLKP